MKMLLAGRVLQGTGGGGLIILANICISDLFSQRYGIIARLSNAYKADTLPENVGSILA